MSFMPILCKCDTLYFFSMTRIAPTTYSTFQACVIFIHRYNLHAMRAQFIIVFTWKVDEKQMNKYLRFTQHNILNHPSDEWLSICTLRTHANTHIHTRVFIALGFFSRPGKIQTIVGKCRRNAVLLESTKRIVRFSVRDFMQKKWMQTRIYPSNVVISA